MARLGIGFRGTGDLKSTADAAELRRIVELNEAGESRSVTRRTWKRVRIDAR